MSTDDYQLVRAMTGGACEVRCSHAICARKGQAAMLLAEFDRHKAALERIDALNPDDFKSGQSHLPPGFRTVVMRVIVGIVNDALHPCAGSSTGTDGAES